MDMCILLKNGCTPSDRNSSISRLRIANRHILLFSSSLKEMGVQAAGHQLPQPL
ncbi:hypothetical protein AAEY33_05555 [Peribacillus simplex]|uniref:hypothetical protein n=1 Tax=Peribacillus simplex TaxID=1478 RepID=UPI0032642A16